MEDLSFKTTAKLPKTLDVKQNEAMGPNDKDIMAQLNMTDLQSSELAYSERQMNLSSQMIRNHHGIGAQLKYMMEINATNKIGRLPFLPSSNASRDALLGIDEMITPTDIYGTSEFSEKMVQPHAIMEKRLGIL